VVTIPWAAPEVVSQVKGYDACKADVWSFGCTLLEIATRKRPWYHIDCETIFPLLLTIGASDELPIIPEELPQSLQKFIKDCLIRDPNKRPSVKELLQNEFFENYN
jgi:serine/threonine protein kinase